MRVTIRARAEIFAAAADAGRGNASRGFRNLARFYLAHRELVDTWVKLNPENEEPEPPPTRRRGKR